MKILNDSDLSSKMSHAGQKFMNGRTLETETEGFYRAFNNVMNGQLPTGEDIPRSYRKSPFEASLARPDIANTLTFAHQSL
jgi:hypothetical protein